MPVDQGASPKDRAIAIGAVVFCVVCFVILYFVAQATQSKPQTNEERMTHVKDSTPGAGKSAGDE